MKIMVCGKGGCGKSTISALLAKTYALQGKEVLVIDSDESNYGLHTQLGLELPPEFTGYLGGKERLLGEMMSATSGSFPATFFRRQWRLSDIPAEYLSQEEHIRLLSAGKIHRAGEGCACAFGEATRQLVDHLILEPCEIAIVDMEAGIEHFGRGIDDSADVILMVIDPSFESLKLSRKVSEISASIGKPIYYILNKVNRGDEAYMQDMVGHEALVFYARSEIAMAGLKDVPLSGDYPVIQQLAEDLLNMGVSS